ncbi:MAG: NAD(+) synthase [Bacteriovoracaceae bacterium]|nr:NAD(+) synthase [Bacteriovoracaceae bacterium]
MQLNLNQTHHEIGDFEAIFQDLTEILQRPNSEGLNLFPELFLTGYPLQDLPLQKSFIQEYMQLLEDINLWSERRPKSNKEQLALLGGLNYHFSDQGQLLKIENVMYSLKPGEKLKVVAVKQLLPTYDLYEEKKYFSAGKETSILEFQGKKIGLLICEDMWFSHLHAHDPVRELQKLAPLDLCINLSASPYHLQKFDERLKRANEVAELLKCPVAYVNRVGFEDEILFDGQSFLTDGKSLVLKADLFKKDFLNTILPKFQSNGIAYPEQPTSSWSTIFYQRLTEDKKRLRPLTDTECLEILNALIFSLQEYAQKTNMQKFLVALSGGMDSALVLTIAKLALTKNQQLEAVFMPGFFSSSLSYDLSLDLCRNLGIKLTTFPIKFIHSTIRNNYRDTFQNELKGLADENIQSRLRGALIYARSNDTGAMVINTSNKSELAVGYSTLYGDSVGALSILGDLYKTEVFELAKFINKKYPGIIPADIIARPPSAELREDQKDEDSLLPYPELDALLEHLLSYQTSPEDLKKLGFKEKDIQKIHSLWQRSEYKRKQFCPIVKIKHKSFGFGYRNPILKKTFTF